MKNPTTKYYFFIIVLSALGCTTSKELATNNTSKIRGKAQELAEKIKLIEAQDYTQEIYTDSISFAFCQHLQYVDFNLLEKALNEISTDEAMMRFDLDTTQVSWEHHRVSSMIRSLASFTTDGVRYSQDVIEEIADKTQSLCLDQYSFYRKTQGMYGDKIRELEIIRMNNTLTPLPPR